MTLANDRDEQLGKGESDFRLTNQCFELISRLEQKIALIDEETSARRATDALQFAKEFMAEVLEFGLEHLGDESLDPYRDRVQDLHERIKTLESTEDHSWKQVFMRVLFPNSQAEKLKAQDDSSFQHAFVGIGRDLFELSADCLSAMEGQFSAKDNAAQWQSTYQLFLEDAGQHWHGYATAHQQNHESNND